MVDHSFYSEYLTLIKFYKIQYNIGTGSDWKVALLFKLLFWPKFPISRTTLRSGMVDRSFFSEYLTFFKFYKIQYNIGTGSDWKVALV